MNYPLNITVNVRHKWTTEEKRNRRERIQRGETVEIPVRDVTERIYTIHYKPDTPDTIEYKLTNGQDEGYVFGEMTRSHLDDEGKAFGRELMATLQADLYRAGLEIL